MSEQGDKEVDDSEILTPEEEKMITDSFRAFDKD